MSIIIFILILLVLVVSHEFGHFIVAKKSGIRVDEFSFGFPPKLFGKKFGETTYNFNLLPLGGYVKIYGQGSDDFPGQNGEEVTDLDKERSFMHKPRYIQAAVLFAGVLMNFLVAWLLFSIVLMTSGLPTLSGDQPTGYSLQNIQKVILSVSPKSPAQIAGLKPGDVILSIKTGSGDVSNIDTESLRNLILSNPNEEIIFNYIHPKSNVSMTSSILPKTEIGGISPKVGLGIGEIGNLKLPVPMALYMGMRITCNKTLETFSGFYNLIIKSVKGEASMSELSGPVGLTGMVGDAYTLGLSYLLSFTAVISLSLAVLNLIPFPALDGGRLLFLLIEKIKGSKIKPKIENITNMIGFGLLMLLMVIITYHDIVKLL